MLRTLWDPKVCVASGITIVNIGLKMTRLLVETCSFVLPYMIKWLCWRTLYNIILHMEWLHAGGQWCWLAWLTVHRCS